VVNDEVPMMHEEFGLQNGAMRPGAFQEVTYAFFN
jgi:hypothetical protein